MDLNKEVSKPIFYGSIALCLAFSFGLILREVDYIVGDYEHAIATDAQTIEMLSAK